MYHLTVQNGAARGSSWPVGDGVVLLGRSRECTVQIPNDTAVSRVHCELRVDGREVTVKHLSKRSVTLLNGKVVQEARLNAGDTLTVGLTTLLLARNAREDGDGLPPGALATRTIGEADAVYLGGGGAEQALSARVDSLRDLAELFRLSNAFNEAESKAQLLDLLASAIRARFSPAAAWWSLSAGDEPAPLPGFARAPADDAVNLALGHALESARGALVPQGAEGGWQALLAAPLSAGGHTLGAVVLAHQADAPVYGEDDLQFLVALCRAAAPCVNTVERIAGLRSEVTRLRAASAAFPELLGESEVMRRLRAEIGQSAQSRLNILIRGESGTGKELAAGMTHAHAEFCDGPFVVVNCAAIPAEMLESELFGYKSGAFTGAASARQGLIARADGGTLFLDEVGDLSPDNQARVLRVIETGVYRPLGSDEERHARFRVVSATNRDLPAMVAGGQFRGDLYHRLNGFEIVLPPLREHLEDIPVLAEHFFHRAMANAKRPLKGIAPAAMAKLSAAPWPGNARQLRNVVERGTVMARGEFIECDDLALSTEGAHVEAADTSLTLVEAERRHITAVFTQCQGDASSAARILGLSRSTFYEKLKKHGIAAREARTSQ